MDYYNCVKCSQSVPEIGGYDIVDGKVVCQDCLSQNVREGEKKMFIIKCSECGTLAELEDGFLKKAGEIAIYNSGENIVSLQCNECENEIFSSED